MQHLDEQCPIAPIFVLIHNNNNNNNNVSFVYKL